MKLMNNYWKKHILSIDMRYDFVRFTCINWIIFLDFVKLRDRSLTYINTLHILHSLFADKKGGKGYYWNHTPSLSKSKYHISRVSRVFCNYSILVLCLFHKFNKYWNATLLSFYVTCILDLTFTWKENLFEYKNRIPTNADLLRTQKYKIVIHTSLLSITRLGYGLGFNGLKWGWQGTFQSPRKQKRSIMDL